MAHKDIHLSLAGTFTSITDENNSAYTYDLDQLKTGINFQEQHIIKLSNDKHVDWVVSRICDHASGTLEPCKDKNFAECPLHGWKLDLDLLHYSNVNVSKKQLAFEIDNNTLYVREPKTHLKLPNNIIKQQQKNDLEIRFIAHACLLFTCGDIKIITDPWITGPCFLNSWWHRPAPCDDALDQLLTADLVYISHNHPDHMHEETLVKLYQHRPDILIVIPNFKTKSTEKPLKDIGFKNIIPLAFNTIHKIDSHDIYLSILKSGDFRDDSGLYLSYGKKQALITVDSSSLNHYVLPTNIDLLATSFASGASGHPWCFDHYSENKKLDIAHNRHLSVKNSILKYIESCKPKSYMPFAGYFSEDAPRDNYIKQNNIKNSHITIESLVQSSHPDITCINPTITDKITISDSIQKQSSGINRLPHIPEHIINEYLIKEKLPEFNTFIKAIQQYFLASEFKDDLLLYLLPCHSDFQLLEQGLIIDFTNDTNIQIDDSQSILSMYQKEYSDTSHHQRQLLIKVRATALWQVIQHHKSWEELSIGFHCRIHRKPDIYNSDFWYHFSNIYIN